ncbi:hypothetical protein [Methanosarcina sp. WWM596]|uniref:hypothetical protein n=1 Tax=Methanosarcina sp. WWM596 TaxID=1434103 RepID=UPI000B146768|nr:hypothetical protein [Methanosarcina sp. WWM596]
MENKRLKTEYQGIRVSGIKSQASGSKTRLSKNIEKNTKISEIKNKIEGWGKLIWKME